MNGVNNLAMLSLKLIHDSELSLVHGSNSYGVDDDLCNLILLDLSYGGTIERRVFGSIWVR